MIFVYVLVHHTLARVQSATLFDYPAVYNNTVLLHVLDYLSSCIYIFFMSYPPAHAHVILCCGKLTSSTPIKISSLLRFYYASTLCTVLIKCESCRLAVCLCTVYHTTITRSYPTPTPLHAKTESPKIRRKQSLNQCVALWLHPGAENDRLTATIQPVHSEQ